MLGRSTWRNVTLVWFCGIRTGGDSGNNVILRLKEIEVKVCEKLDRLLTVGLYQWTNWIQLTSALTPYTIFFETCPAAFFTTWKISKSLPVLHLLTIFAFYQDIFVLSFGVFFGAMLCAIHSPHPIVDPCFLYSIDSGNSASLGFSIRKRNTSWSHSRLLIIIIIIFVFLSIERQAQSQDQCLHAWNKSERMGVMKSIWCAIRQNV